jgi:molybdopterin-dependent oxidoreductase alpha subunit
MSDDAGEIKDYKGPAGGWGALKSVVNVLADQETIVEGARTLLRANQPDGFDCPGCAWPDPKHTSSFEFCENGAKAVAWEATSKRAGPDFFAAHTVSELWEWSGHKLEDVGRLSEPMAYDAASDRYLPVSWDDAFARIGAAMRALQSPDQAEFYASGRASNEAAFLFQLLGRRFGTNNFPDCSNMCHEPTSVALPDSVGVGKGSVSLEDFDHADAIFSFGHNPGTNHPRMMTTLRDASRRGCRILVFNPLKERALERFAAPQDAIEMATLSSTPIASEYYQLSIGGDVALVKGLMKATLAFDAADLAAGGPGKLDRDFIAEHTAGFDALAVDIEATTWEEIEAGSGLSRAQIEQAAEVYVASERVILCYGMGITQHRSASAAVGQLMNLLLLRGNIGRPGAGICPVRGHSNVQGARTVGISEKPPAAMLDAIESVFGFAVPRAHGHTVVEAIEAMEAGASKALICLGGNLAVAAPDPQATYAAMRRLDLHVNIATKLNRTHLLVGRETLLLPCLGRTEIDIQASGRQSVTVEDSMSMVHASRGMNQPASPHLRSEPAIVAGIAKAIWPDGGGVDWDGLTADYDRTRDAIAAVFPDLFAGYNERVRTPGGFRLPLAHADRVWKTRSGKANFLIYAADGEEPRRGDPDVLLLTTIRSHDQYNTTVYGLNDRYRGVSGTREVVFIGAADLAARGLRDGDHVDIEAAFPGGVERVVRNYRCVERDLPAGSIAGYYPELNPLIALDARDRRSGTPAYKSVPVRIRTRPA